MINIDDYCQALTGNGWTVRLEFEVMARSMDGRITYGSWDAVAEREPDRLGAKGYSPSEAVVGLFWKVAQVDQDIDAELGKT